ncbi:MAG: hypothetical protein IJS68_01715 [Clostridia bacterium]|nr:hypothetical protein [Clostridia bacterium]
MGIFAILSGTSFSGVLRYSDKNILNYISGSASTVSIFLSKLFESVVCFLLIYIFCLSSATALLSYVFFGYQNFLLAISCSVIIDIYGFPGVLNVAILIIPINLAVIFVMALAISVARIRAMEAKKYNEPLSASFKMSGFYKKYLIVFLLMIVVCLIYSFIMPLLLKSFLLILY